MGGHAPGVLLPVPMMNLSLAPPEFSGLSLLETTLGQILQVAQRVVLGQHRKPCFKYTYPWKDKPPSQTGGIDEYKIHDIWYPVDYIVGSGPLGDTYARNIIAG